MRAVFETEEDFRFIFDEYILKCKEEKELANIAGFCVFAGIGRQTYYDQEERYPYTFKRCSDVLEDRAINCKDINDTFKIFYMKNKCGYKDKTDVEAVTKTEIRVDLDD